MTFNHIFYISYAYWKWYIIVFGISGEESTLIKLIYYLAFSHSLTVTYISPSTLSRLISSPAEKDSLIEWYHYLDKVMEWTILQSHMIWYDNSHAPLIEGSMTWTYSQIKPVLNLKILWFEHIHKLDLSWILSSIHHILSPLVFAFCKPLLPLPKNHQWPLFPWKVFHFRVVSFFVFSSHITVFAICPPSKKKKKLRLEYLNFFRPLP